MQIEYVDHMGTDLLIANAARKSFGKGFTKFMTNEDGPRTPRGRSDEQLIIDLVADGHFLPFRHPHVILSCSEALPIARQLGKHQVGKDWSEISRRYKTKDIHFTYLDGKWRFDLEDRKQGTGELADNITQELMKEIQARNIKNCLNDYDEALRLGVAPEQARYLLPQAMEAEWTWTGSLLSWAHLYKQRTHQDSQKEAQEFAHEVDRIIRPLFPVAWAALIGEGS